MLKFESISSFGDSFIINVDEYYPNSVVGTTHIDTHTHTYTHKGQRRACKVCGEGFSADMIRLQIGQHALPLCTLFSVVLKGDGEDTWRQSDAAFSGGLQYECVTLNHSDRVTLHPR